MRACELVIYSETLWAAPILGIMVPIHVENRLFEASKVALMRPQERPLVRSDKRMELPPLPVSARQGAMSSCSYVRASPLLYTSSTR